MEEMDLDRPYKIDDSCTLLSMSWNKGFVVPYKPNCLDNPSLIIRNRQVSDVGKPRNQTWA